jgi:hypothetical protein
MRRSDDLLAGVADWRNWFMAFALWAVIMAVAVVLP